MLQRLRQRRAFTLIELLVTLGLVIVLLSIAVAVSNSSMMDSYKITNAGDRVSQALLTAKARAARDKAPRGVRLIAGNDGFIREMIYVEQPEPWLPNNSESLGLIAGSVSPVYPVSSMFVVRFPEQPAGVPNTFQKPLPVQCRAYLILNNTPVPNRPDGSPRGPTDYQRFVEQVRVGDTVHSPDLGTSVMVYNLAPSGPVLEFTPPGFVEIDLGVTVLQNPDLAAGQTPLATPTRGTFRTTKFGVHRAPLPLVGEPAMLLSRNVAVDAPASLPSALLAPGQVIDIVFSPSGHVMNRSEGIIALLVRDTTKFTAPAGINWLTDPATAQASFANAGEMLLVTVFPRTGNIAVKPVAAPSPPNPDPYQFARDAISAGL